MPAPIDPEQSIGRDAGQRRILRGGAVAQAEDGARLTQGLAKRLPTADPPPGENVDGMPADRPLHESTKPAWLAQRLAQFAIFHQPRQMGGQCRGGGPARGIECHNADAMGLQPAVPSCAPRAVGPQQDDQFRAQPSSELFQRPAVWQRQNDLALVAPGEPVKIVGRSRGEDHEMAGAQLERRVESGICCLNLPRIPGYHPNRAPQRRQRQPGAPQGDPRRHPAAGAVGRRICASLGPSIIACNKIPADPLTCPLFRGVPIVDASLHERPWNCSPPAAKVACRYHDCDGCDSIGAAGRFLAPGSLCPTGGPP